MKTIATLLFLAASAAAFGQAAEPAPGPSRPACAPVQTEVGELARGYAAAFAGMTHSPVYLVHSRDDNSSVIAGVRSVRALDGVLVVVDEKGVTYVLDPRDVVMITDAPPKKEQ